MGWVRQEFDSPHPDQLKLFSNSEAIGCSLAPPSAGLASQKALYFGIKTEGRTNSNSVFRESKRRFGIAKQFTNEICIQFFPFFAKGKNTKQIFNPALLRRRRNGQRRHYKLRSKYYENKIFSLRKKIYRR